MWTSYEATGLGRVGLNKGGAVIYLRIGATHLAFVGSHLAAHQSECGRRNQDVAEIIREVGRPPCVCFGAGSRTRPWACGQ